MERVYFHKETKQAVSPSVKGHLAEFVYHFARAVFFYAFAKFDPR